VLAASSRHGETAVSWPTPSGGLSGILRTGSRSEAVLFFHGLGGLRSGPHGLLSALGRAASAHGFTTLCFDFSSRGEGEGDGEADGATLPGMAQEALSAAEFLAARDGVERIIVVGICSGGNIAIGTMDRLPRLAGLFLLSVYPFSDGDSFERDTRRTASFLRVYWRKLSLWETWGKFFRGQIMWSGIHRTLFGHVGKSADDDLRARGTRGDGEVTSPRENLVNFPVPTQLTYGDADPDYEASRSYYADFAGEHDLPVEISVVSGAPHNYCSALWKDALCADLLAFLAKVS